MKLEDYNPNDSWGMHLVKIKFQVWKYKGFLTYKIFGNCRGLGVFGNFDIDSLWKHDFIDNKINFKILDDNWCKISLFDDEGNELEGEYEYTELDGMVVGLEIIDFIKEASQ